MVQPKYLTGGVLRDYQLDGLKWMLNNRKVGLSGILADEMGLGKTIQSISLICALLERRVPGPYLIIVPMSTIPNWQIEFEKFAPIIPVVTLHGPKDTRPVQIKKITQKFPIEDDFKSPPVILTTYDTVLMDIKYLKQHRWQYIIIDEGHRIKNNQSMLCK